MSNQPQAEGQFKKDLRKIDIWALALGAIIGWGCFVLPGTDFLPRAGPLGAILGLLLGRRDHLHHQLQLWLHDPEVPPLRRRVRVL